MQTYHLVSHIVWFYFVCIELGYVDVVNTAADSSVCDASVAMLFAHMMGGKHLHISVIVPFVMQPTEIRSRHVDIDESCIGFDEIIHFFFIEGTSINCLVFFYLLIFIYCFGSSFIKRREYATRSGSTDSFLGEVFRT